MAVWMKMFGELLNVESCAEMPDLMTLRKQLVLAVECQVTASQLNAYVRQLYRQLTN